MSKLTEWVPNTVKSWSVPGLVLVMGRRHPTDDCWQLEQLGESARRAKKPMTPTRDRMSRPLSTKGRRSRRQRTGLGLSSGQSGPNCLSS